MLSFTQSKLYIFIALCTLNTAILVGCFCLFVSFCNILNINDKQKTSFKITRNFPVCPFVVQHVGLVVTCVLSGPHVVTFGPLPSHDPLSGPLLGFVVRPAAPGLG